MGRSKHNSSDVHVAGKRVLLEAYLKIIPCRKVTVNSVSKTGKILTTQQKENVGEAIIMPVSEQEIVSNNVEDFYFADSTELMTADLFSWEKQTFNSRISVKCPVVENEKQYKRLLKYHKETKNFKTSSKDVDIDVSIEISKHLEQLKRNLENSKCMAGEPNVQENSEVQKDDLNILSLPPLPIDDTISVEPINNETETQADENICSNNNALDSNGKSEDKRMVSEDQSNATPTRRSNRRVLPNEKYNLAIQILKPMASKTEKLDKKEGKNESIDDSNKDMKDEINNDEYTYELKKDNSPINKGKSTKTVSEVDILEKNVENSKTLSIEDEINLINHSKATQVDPDEPSEEGYTCTRSRKRKPIRPKVKIEDEVSKKKRKAKIIVKADGEVVHSQRDEEDIKEPDHNAKHGELDNTVTIDALETGDIDVFADLSDAENDEEFILESNRKSSNPFMTAESTCKICSVVLAPGSLVKHMKLHREERIKKEFKCPTCGKILQSELKLNLHQNTHMSENSDGKFECEKCNKMYATKSALFKHRRTGRCATEFECSICFVSFSCERSLEKHNNHFHAEKSMARLKCKLCNKRFVTRGGLNRHMSLKQCHTDLSCHICQRTFLKSSAFQTHMLKHQESETQDAKTYQCDLCGNFLGSYHSLKKHVSRHLNVRNQECTICHKKFLDQTELRTHMRTHSKEKPYICDICPQRFGQSGHMLRHKLQVHKIGKFPFVCDTCGKGFVDRRNIIMHTKMHENRAKRQLEKPSRKKKLKGDAEVLQNYIVKTEPGQLEESSVIQIDGGYDITELLGAHMTQTNSDGSQTIISSSTNLQSIEHILQAASENTNNVEYISTEEIPVDQVYTDQPQGYISLDNIKVEHPLLDSENIVYTIEDGSTVQSIPASDLGILAETAQQFQNGEEITYYIIKKE